MTLHDAPASGRRLGIALTLGSSASTQTGAAIGALAFPAMGPVGVVAIRQLVLAAVLVPLVRPRLWRLTREQWWPIVGMALVLCLMNLSVYAAIERIGLGLAITLEFLGPLGVAIAVSRRWSTRACALVAALGVAILVRPGAATDLLGMGLALLAALSWAAYILLGRTLGRRLAGLEGTAAASLVTTLVWVPVAILWFSGRPQEPLPIVLALVCGVLSSLVPYSVDIMALRRVPTALFGALTSAHPVWAALIGWIILAQPLGGLEWTGIALIVLSNVAVTLTERDPVVPPPAAPGDSVSLESARSADDSADKAAPQEETWPAHSSSSTSRTTSRRAEPSESTAEAPSPRASRTSSRTPDTIS